MVLSLHDGIRSRGIKTACLSLLNGSDKRTTTCSSLRLSSPYSIRALIGISNYLRSNVRPGDIVHAHLFPTTLYVSLLKQLGMIKNPCLCTEHSTSNRRRNHWFGVLVDRFTYKGFDRVVTISIGVRDALVSWQAILENRVLTVHNGDALKHSVYYRRPERDHLTILSVGNLRDPKNYPVALEAVASLENWEFEYWIAGEGADRAMLERLTSDFGLKSKVKFLGYREDIPALLKAADVFLMPSKYEGFGLAALEAMNAGLPVVVSDVPGLKELVGVNPQAAMLVDPESPESIANALKKLLRSRQLRIEFGERAFEQSFEFSLDKMIDSYLEVYKELSDRAA